MFVKIYLINRYGFRTNPKLWLSAKPKVGERAVTVTHVTEWIEKKLSVEFQVNFNLDLLVAYESYRIYLHLRMI